MSKYYTDTKYKLGQPVYCLSQQTLFKIYQIDFTFNNGPVYYLINSDKVKLQAREEWLTPFRNTTKQMKLRLRGINGGRAEDKRETGYESRPAGGEVQKHG